MSCNRKILIRGLLSGVVAGIFTAAEAHASTDNYLEIQIDSDVMSTIIRNQFAKNSDFCPQIITCPGGASCVVDHLEIGDPGGWSRAASDSSVEINNFTTLQAPKVLYTQEFTAHLKTMSCAEDPSCSATIPFPATAVFELYMNPNSELCITDHEIIGLPPGVTPPSATLCLGLELDDVLELTGQSSGTVSGRALSLNGAGSRVAMRVEYGMSGAYTAARINAWQNFIDGTLESAGASDDWSLFTHKSLILAALIDRINTGLATVSGFELTTGIAATWTSLGAAGGMATLQFDAVATDTDCPNDIGIEPVILSAATGINAAHDGLQSDGSISWNLDDGDVFWCGFAFGGFVGASILAVIADSMNIDLSLLGADCTPTGDTTFTCNQKTHPQVLSLGIGQSATFKLGAVTGDSDGLAMNGDIAIAGGNAPLYSDVQIATPFLGYNGGCYSGTCDYTGGLSVYGNAPICNVEFSADPLGVYEIIGPPGPSYGMPAHWTIKVSPYLPAATIAAFEAAPYGSSATVWTAAGVKTVEMEPVSLLSDFQESIQCGAGKIDYKLTYCMNVHEWPWQKIYWGWYPDDWIDPQSEIAIQVLDARARFLDYGLVEDLDFVAVRDRSGRVLSAMIRGSAYAGVGNEQLVSQGLSIGLSVPRDTFIASDADLIAYLLPNGYSATIELDRTLAPPHAIGASFALEISPAQLQHAAH